MTATRRKRQISQPQKNARLAAARSLISWIQSNTIDFLPRDIFPQPADFTFYKRLVSNVIRHKSKYEFFIHNLTSKPLKNLDSEVVACLMLGLTQLEADSRVESYAAINETVELLSLLKKPYLKGFVNANLRRFSREMKQLESALKNQALAIRSSHNKDFIKRWENHFGQKITTDICHANNIEPQLQLIFNPRFNPEQLRKELEDEGYLILDHHPKGLTIENPAGLFESESWKKGAFLVQDRSFQQLNKILADIPKSFVLDICSAPGGKLIHLEWCFQNEIELLIGCDIIQSRMNRLRENILHFKSNAQVVLSDALKPSFKESFDLIILDAPCSATGTIRKHPEIKWSRTQKDLEINQKKQIAMLKNCSSLVKPGGHLLYITCSLEFEENQSVIQQFIQTQHNNFQIIRLNATLKNSSQVTDEGFYQALPSPTQMGCFAALLRKPVAR